MLGLDQQCRAVLTEKYQFPDYLFESSWTESNGFAGLIKIPSSAPGSLHITVSWFRVPIKDLGPAVGLGVVGYIWHELTFLIYDAGLGAPTVLCCGISDRFYDHIRATLKSKPAQILDWRSVHALLSHQVAVELDYVLHKYFGVVRRLERTRPTGKSPGKPNFGYFHDLVRHTLQASEILQMTIQNLSDWMELYRIHTGIRDTALLTDPYYHDMYASLQLIKGLLKRSDVNEARLRNEISLSYNIVNYSDARDVRIISVVTLLFLPATFVSTLFSMSFFSFQPPYQSGWGVSPEIWKYFAVSVPITALVIVTWFWRWPGVLWDKLMVLSKILPP